MKSIFVSSTFKDMHFERDVLNRRVAPKLNHQLASYNQSVRILDLRWGVDTSDMTEQDASDRVLSSCFKAIDDCKPYMVILLGDRYGYIPDGSDVSVTHMEIIRGVFECADNAHLYVYFRDSDYSAMPDDFKSLFIEQDESAKSKLDALKNELMKEYPQCCRHYKASWSEKAGCLVSDEFERMITEDLESDFLRENQGICYRSDLHKQICENEEILADRIRFAYSNTKKVEADVASVVRSELPYGIIGDGGTGKSVYMSMLCGALRDVGKHTHILFCGDNAFSASVRSAAEMVLYILTEALGEEYDFEQNAALSYDDLIARMIEKRASVTEMHFLLLDAVDKCDTGMVNFIYWCDSFLKEQLKIVFSSRMIEELHEQKDSFSFTEMQYDRDDYREMVRCLLYRHAKSISDVHTELLLDKAKTPLQLNLLLLRLLNMRTSDFENIQQMGGGIDAINAYLHKLIEDSPAETDLLVVAYLQSLMQDNENMQFALYLLNILAYCEYGLPEDDIRALFDLNDIKWVELDYVEFLEQFGFFVRIRDNGRLDLSHDVIRQTLRGVFNENKKMICSMISMYLFYSEKKDVISVRTFLDVTAEIGQHKRFLEFVKQYKDALLSFDPAEVAFARELRSGVVKLFFKDQGEFLFGCVGCCRSADDVAYFQMVFSSSLLSINDYHSEETILTIAYAAILIPSRLEFYVDNLFEMELLSCERFLKRHNVSQSKIDEFIAASKQAHQSKNRSDESKRQDASKSVESILESLHRVSEEDRTDKLLLWVKLAKSARAMSTDEKSARRAEKLSLELIAILDEGVLLEDEAMRDISYADVYTTLGNVYKSLKEWQKGVDYDTLSLQIYKKIYENSPSEDIFKKYRERVYNLANITEAWAMEEINNPELWEMTRERYEEAYALELTAMSHGLSERDVLQSASTILSLGTAFINLGRFDEGMTKYNEGIALIMNTAKNNSSADLYTELSIHLLECIYQLLVCNQRDAAHKLSEHVGKYLRHVVESDSSAMVGKINDICIAFSNNLNDMVRKLHDQEDLDGQIIVSRILYRVYDAILPVAPHIVKANMISTKSNICAILFWQKQDYEQAYIEYQELLHATVEFDLAAPDESGHFVDAVNGRLVDAYVRLLLSLEKCERQEEVKALVGEAAKWATYIADRIDAIKGDVPFVLHSMSVSLTRNNSPLGLLFAMLAFNEMSKDTYDKESHQKTVMMILESLSSFGGGEDA